jgi:fission 1 protein
VEPENRQAQELDKLIKDKMTKEGLLGMAMVGGAALAIGGLVGLGMALAKK